MASVQQLHRPEVKLRVQLLQLLFGIVPGNLPPLLLCLTVGVVIYVVSLAVEELPQHVENRYLLLLLLRPLRLPTTLL